MQPAELLYWLFISVVQELQNGILRVGMANKSGRDSPAKNWSVVRYEKPAAAAEEAPAAAEEAAAAEGQARAGPTAPVAAEGGCCCAIS